MSEYTKKTVADLTEILKSRGLPHSGKKADLIARLTEDDAKSTAPVEDAAPAPAPAEPAEDTSASAPTAVASTEPPSTVQSATVASAPTDGQTEVEAQPTTDSASYALNLPTSDLDSELAKRKARAERFGVSAAAASADTNGDAAAEATPTEGANEALKAAERAKRFGTANSGATTAISKLDEALPTDGPRGRASNKRKAEETSLLDDPGLKRGFANRGRGAARGGRFAHRQRGGDGANRNGGAGKGPQGVTKAPAYTSEKDKAAAEARKKKFATA